MYVWHGVSELVEVRLSGHLEAYEDEDDRHRQARHRDASVIAAQHHTHDTVRSARVVSLQVSLCGGGRGGPPDVIEVAHIVLEPHGGHAHEVHRPATRTSIIVKAAQSHGTTPQKRALSSPPCLTI